MLLGGFVLMLLFWFGTKMLLDYGDTEQSYDERRAKERAEIRDRVLAEANKVLNEYAWIDAQQGLVQLPVQRAMELTVAALAENNTIQPAGFIDPLKALAEQQPAAESAPPADAAQSPSPESAPDTAPAAP